jgi:PPOX class probable F420-dependent enzyme
MVKLSTKKQAFITDFLQRPLTARLATVDENHHPHVVPVWFGWDGDNLWVSSFSNTRKVKNIRGNTHISITVDIEDKDGATQAIILEGAAELVTQPHDFLKEKFTWIYERYLGMEGVQAKNPQSWINDEKNLLIRLAPQRVITWNW